MRHRTAILTIIAAVSGLMSSTGGIAADRAPATIFRITANGPSPDKALQDATQVIGQLCAASGYVILNNQIKPSPDGVFYYGPVTARCMA